MTKPNAFDRQLAAHRLSRLTAASLDTLQVNLGKLCNQACRHCHVDAGPQQTGSDVNMGDEIVEHVLRVLRSCKVETLDLTGGAPELNPHFRILVGEARSLDIHVIDRCNLSVLTLPEQDDLAAYLARNQVEVVASLPYYRRDRTDRQRGRGVFDASIQGLKLLNDLGYGHSDQLRLNLVLNPVGAYLPGDQAGLEAEYKRELASEFDIHFHQLYCITNMPIARYREWLDSTGKLDSYMQTLSDAFNPQTVEALMCRKLISVAPDGTLHDCDFNQMLDLPLATASNIRDFDAGQLAARQIVTKDHCLGCTAGAGSSCGGTVT
ncbi:MAG: arsenosugar biosynthesis radical SAM (seleno)protein ArsS [Planctomycetota bacterium]|nr:arsenosugar biosynthesis radical SAM (seleno)protein ArsS [Planctomycetota bacterium]